MPFSLLEATLVPSSDSSIKVVSDMAAFSRPLPERQCGSGWKIQPEPPGLVHQRTGAPLLFLEGVEDAAGPLHLLGGELRGPPYVAPLVQTDLQHPVFRELIDTLL